MNSLMNLNILFMFRHLYNLQITWTPSWYYHNVKFDSLNEVPTLSEYQKHFEDSLSIYPDNSIQKKNWLAWLYWFNNHVYFLKD